MGIGPGARPEPSDWWSKSAGENAAVEMGMRLKWTHMQRRLEEKELFRTCLKVRTIVNGTIKWKAYEGRFGS